MTAAGSTCPSPGPTSLGTRRIKAANVRGLREVGGGRWVATIKRDGKYGESNAQKRREALGAAVAVSADLEGCITLLVEAQLMLALEHQNILRVVGFTVDAPPAVLFFEATPHGTVRSYLQQLRRNDNWPPTRRELVGCCAGVASALVYLERLSIVHTNVQAASILLGESGLKSPKLTQFRNCKSVLRQEYYVKPAEIDHNSNSIRWMPPELLTGGTVGFTCRFASHVFILPL